VTERSIKGHVCFCRRQRGHFRYFSLLQTLPFCPLLEFLSVRELVTTPQPSYPIPHCLEGADEVFLWTIVVTAKLLLPSIRTRDINGFNADGHVPYLLIVFVNSFSRFEIKSIDDARAHGL
jgi:hypothetical protein